MIELYGLVDIFRVSILSLLATSSDTRYVENTHITALVAKENDFSIKGRRRFDQITLLRHRSQTCALETKDVSRVRTVLVEAISSAVKYSRFCTSHLVTDFAMNSQRIHDEAKLRPVNLYTKTRCERR